MRTGLLFVLAIAVSMATPAQADSTEMRSLKPSSVWAMNYADDSCRLIRIFGEGDNQVRLELRGFAPGAAVWALVSGLPVGRTKYGSEKISYRFDPDTTDVPGYALRGELDDGSPSAMFRVSFATLEEQTSASKAYRKDPQGWMRQKRELPLDRERQIDALEIKMWAQPRFALELGSMGPPMQAMRACLDDLLTHWGVDPALQGSHGAGTAPVPAELPSDWLNPSDFPPKMIRERRNSQVDFRLVVDATGKPTDCAVLTMEAIDDFIRATCDRLMKRARFQPARDTHGNAVTGVYVNSVLWIVP
jgi:hypothetical protein